MSHGDTVCCLCWWPKHVCQGEIECPVSHTSAPRMDRLWPLAWQVQSILISALGYRGSNDMHCFSEALNCSVSLEDASSLPSRQENIVTYTHPCMAKRRKVQKSGNQDWWESGTRHALCGFFFLISISGGTNQCLKCLLLLRDQTETFYYCQDTWLHWKWIWTFLVLHHP